MRAWLALRRWRLVRLLADAYIDLAREQQHHRARERAITDRITAIETRLARLGGAGKTDNYPTGMAVWGDH